MTRAELELEVERLRQLVIPEWRVILANQPPPDHDTDDAWATSQSMEDYDQITIHFSDECLERADATIITTIVHELLHGAFRDMRGLIDRLCGQIHRDAWQVWNAQRVHEEERLVDRLSRTIAALDAGAQVADDRPLQVGTSRHLDC